MKYILFIVIVLVFNSLALSQHKPFNQKEKVVNKLIDSLWINPTSFFNNNDKNWRLLCKNLHMIDEKELIKIENSIFEIRENKIKNNSTANVGTIGLLNKCSSKRKIKKFHKKLKNNFTNKRLFPNNKTVLAEGDSWFEYPIFLTDITDNLMKYDNLALYSIASGGDWASNIISSGEYRDKLVNFKPDIFLISGGGNDLLGDGRLSKFLSDKPIKAKAAFLEDYRQYVILKMNNKDIPMCTANYCPPVYREYKDSISTYSKNINKNKIEKIVNGRRYLNKNFYRFLVTFKLQYKILFESIRKIDSAHFDSIKIITQGYDNSIPSSKRKFGIRLFMKNGQWLKKPLELNGILDKKTQESIVMAIIFDFNEMLIELGKEYDNIYHVDIRGFTRYLEKYYNKSPGSFWYNEMHPTNIVFKEISKVYAKIINSKPKSDKRIYNVIKQFDEDK